jgi:hypothetical protein
LFTPLPSEKELAQAGLTAADFEGDIFEVWPENWQAFNLLVDLQTQWRGGGAGLDYNVMYRKMDRMGLTPEQYDELEADMRVQEMAAMDAMHKE